MKKLIAIISLCVICLSLASCRSLLDDSITFEEAAEYVNENYEKLEAIPFDSIPNDSDEEGRFIRKHLGWFSIVDGIYAYNEKIIDFYCGGSGNATNSTYTGFYYSKDDVPFVIIFDGNELTEVAPGVFEWQNEDGSHKYHTERIRENWYYYIADYY